MTDTLAISKQPVWFSPYNLKDNTIIGAKYWNTITATNGSVAWLQKQTTARASCNVFVAEWSTQSIPVKSSASTSSTIIKFTGNTNGYYFKADGGINLPDGVPCLLIWKVWFYGETARTGYMQRSTLQRYTYNASGRVIDNTTVASFFNRKVDASQVVLSASYAVVANNAKDRYYITVNHGYYAAINTRGTCHLIINPGMV